ncbi:hypothetical protein N656DRAFT_686052, partial [Canariomyces notabilis]
TYPTALYVAVKEGKESVVEELIDKGKADINAEGGLYNTPLGAAINAGDDELAVVLLARGADPSKSAGLFSNALSASV